MSQYRLECYLETKSILNGRNATCPFQVAFCFSPVAASVTTTEAEMSEVFSDNSPNSVLFNFTSTQP
jgi:hypothetical protein